eukprot:TRINITY_DN7441_c0_g1_i1.p1 TRINITY_DN7441_c0_g1~~TRINITY_DN7441_c0_g1_i1.p1  ORF type:complete len:421 (-),score=71.04 TRINITY_DN7441_c0_g1_i1:95-1357(-)
MKSFDAFARPVQEFQVKTAVGGYISIGSICLVLTLFLSELRYFLTPETKDEMLIDQNQDQKYFNMSFDITFTAVPCAVLDVNLLDPKKANVLHATHEIFKTRLSKSGRVLGKRIRTSPLNLAMTPRELHDAGFHSPLPPAQTNHSSTSVRCPSCFQSHINEDDCCPSCEDVRKEFRSRGWDDHPDYVFGQCFEEAYRDDPPELSEGCRLQASLHVRKVPGTIHVGVGRHFRDDFMAELRKENLPKPPTPTMPDDELTGMLGMLYPGLLVTSIDFAHFIQDLSFGPDFDGLINVLRGRKKANHSQGLSEHFQYDVHIIPTRFQEDGYDEVSSHQYSVTEYVKPVEGRNPDHEGAPTGLWMNYDFTPFEVRVTRSRKSLWHFVTECCAILGGIFAFSGMLDNFVHHFNKADSSSRRGDVLAK